MSDPVCCVVFVATSSVDGRHLVLVTARQGSCGKVLYSLVAVCLQRRGVTHDAWTPLTPNPLLVRFGGHHWRPVQIFSLEDPSPTSTDIWWPKYAWLTSGRYTSYRNAFLFLLYLHRNNTVFQRARLYFLRF